MLPHKGKPSEFFLVKRDAFGFVIPNSEGLPNLNDEQKKFVWLHYVNYSDPEDMVTILDWLCDVAYACEEEEAEAKKAYGKPKKVKKIIDEDIIQQEEDTNFGVPKKMKKAQPKAAPPPPKKKKDAEGEEKKEKETKAQRVKDVEVTVDED